MHKSECILTIWIIIRDHLSTDNKIVLYINIGQRYPTHRLLYRLKISIMGIRCLEKKLVASNC